MSSIPKSEPTSNPRNHSPELQMGLALLAQGLRPIPLHKPGNFLKKGTDGQPILATGKEPFGNDWGNQRYTPEQLIALYKNDKVQGIGVLLGTNPSPADPSLELGIVDIEVDDPDRAKSVLERMAPEGMKTLGYKSNRGFHRIYRYDPRLAKYKSTIIKGEIKDGKLTGNGHYLGVELRIGALTTTTSAQCQSVIPPTLKADGTRRAWIDCEDNPIAPQAIVSDIWQFIAPFPDHILRDLDSYAQNPPDRQSSGGATSPLKGPAKSDQAGKRQWDVEEVKAALPPYIMALAQEWGVKLTGHRTAKEFYECSAIDREDNKPSAGIHAQSGVYNDFAGTTCSFFELAIKLRAYPDFPSAVNGIGERCGVPPKPYRGEAQINPQEATKRAKEEFSKQAAQGSSERKLAQVQALLDKNDPKEIFLNNDVTFSLAHTAENNPGLFKLIRDLFAEKAKTDRRYSVKELDSVLALIRKKIRDKAKPLKKAAGRRARSGRFGGYRDTAGPKPPPQPGPRAATADPDPAGNGAEPPPTGANAEHAEGESRSGSDKDDFADWGPQPGDPDYVDPVARAKATVRAHEQAIEDRTLKNWKMPQRDGEGEEGEYGKAVRYLHDVTKHSREEVEGEGAAEIEPMPMQAQEIDAKLHEIYGAWPKKAGKKLFIQTRDYKPEYLTSTAQFFGWVWGKGRSDWEKGSTFITQEQYFEHFRRTATKYSTIELIPHEPAMEGIYYMYPPCPESSGKLDELVDYFCWASEEDRTLGKAFIMSLFWGGTPGRRPAWCATGPDNDPKEGRGVGKTTLIDVILETLAGGSVSIVGNEDINDLKTRLLSPEGLTKRGVRLDNVKSDRFSFAELEDFITSSTISGRALYEGEGSRPNTVTVTLTMNGAAMSKDMSQRLMIIKLARPAYDATWEERVRTFSEENRWEIIREIIETLAKPVPENFAPVSRWASWEAGVLSKVSGWEGAQKVILDRQDNIDTDEEAKLEVGDYFRKKLYDLGHEPVMGSYRFSSKLAVQWMSEAENRHHDVPQGSTKLNRMGIPELKKAPKRGAFRGFYWHGPESKAKPGQETLIPDSAAYRDERDCGWPEQTSTEEVIARLPAYGA